MKEKIMEKLRLPDTGKLFDRDELDRRQERFLDANIFLGKLLLVGAIFHLILFIYPETSGIQTVYAGFITDLMNFIGFNFSHSSVYILGEGGGYEITQDCLGWKSVMAFLALVYATPGELKNKLKAVATGTLLILVANVVRVASTIYLSWLGILEFEVIHGLLWRWSLTAVVIVAWIAWMEYFR
jgi:exosortase/archaeosortase family protein